MDLKIDIIEKLYKKRCIRCGKTFCSKGKEPAGICDACEKKMTLNYATTYLGQWVVEQNVYFRIIKETLANRKTPIYHIETLDGISLGEIRWYGAWRKFCLFPSEQTVWDSKCLKYIIDFLDETNKEWREKSE